MQWLTDDFPRHVVACGSSAVGQSGMQTCAISFNHHIELKDTEFLPFLAPKEDFLSLQNMSVLSICINVGSIALRFHIASQMKPMKP